MAMEFNDLLRSVGISPEQVCLIRHHTKPVRGQSLHDLWKRDPEGFERYQSMQSPGRKLFRTRPIWAAFTSPHLHETLFVGLYNATHVDTRIENSPCPYTGGPTNEGKPVDVFATTRRPELLEHIGKLKIEWDRKSIKRWDRYADRAKFPVIEFADIRTATDFLYKERLVDLLTSLGFVRSHTTSKVVELRRDNIILYVKRSVKHQALIVHPRYIDCCPEFENIGIYFTMPPKFYKNSNLREFPLLYSDPHQSGTRYGFALNVTAHQVLNLIKILGTNASVETESGLIPLVGTRDEPLTEQQRLVAARLGQGDFRCALIAYWNGKCPILDVDDITLLRASHIKSWKSSSNNERLDPFNGILLSVQIDLLFDKGLISFCDDGTMLVSSLLSKQNAQRIGLPLRASLRGLEMRHLNYLAHHRRVHGFEK